VNGRHVAATEQAALGIEELRIGQHISDGAKTDDEGQQVEVADPAGRPHHRLARFLGAGHGEKAHQDVRQAGGAEHQRHAKGDGRNRVFHEVAGAHDGLPELGRFLGRLAAI